jgi:hypothetical protein
MITVLAQHPEPDAIMGRDTDIFVAASSTDGFGPSLLKVVIDDVVVFDGQEGFGRTGAAMDGSDGFVRPDWDGRITLTPLDVAIRIFPRRLFDNNAEVVVTATFAPPPPLTGTTASTWSFRIVDREHTRLTAAQLSPAQRRLNLPFPLSALDHYRQLLGSTLTPDPSLVSQAAVFRIEQSCCRPLLGMLQVAPPFRFKDGELLRLSSITTALTGFTGLWEQALRELGSLGIGPQTLGVLRRAMKEGGPMDQAGAVCGAVLLAAMFLEFQGR